MKIEVNGVHLAYETWGHTERPIVLMHGFGLDRSIWRDLATKYLADQQVILPDLRGHGESDAPVGPYHMSQLAEDLVYLLDAREVERAVVCGHSMGGYVALAFAAQFAERLLGLGLITTNAGSDSEEKRAGRYALIEEVRERGSIAVAENLAPRLSRSQAVIDASFTLIDQTEPLGLIGAMGGMAERPERTGLLSQINVPALVVAGEDDRITDFKTAKAMADALMKGEFLGIPDVGHMPMWEAPDILGRGLKSLVARVS